MSRTLLTCSPLFHEPALNEIRRTQPDLRIIDSPAAPGLIVLKTDTSFHRLVQPWRRKLPIYLHHIFPIRTVIDLPGAEPGTLIDSIRKIRPAGAALQIRSRFEWASACSEVHLRCVLGDTGTGSMRPPRGAVVSTVVIPWEGGARAYVGVSMAGENISPWAGGIMPVDECVPNRAGYKLLEALSSFGIRLARGGSALDLGAAPGAWTTLLRRRGMRVTAIAPAPLYSWLAIDRGVTHHPTLAEDFLGECRETFDFIANDMKLDGQDSARLMVDYARHLHSEGIGLMTIKLRQETRLRVLDHALRLLRKAYRVVRVRQMVSNGHEVTVVLRRK